MPEAHKLENVSSDEYEEIENFCEKGGLPRTFWLKSDMVVNFVIRDSDNSLAAVAKLERHDNRPFIEDLVVRADLRGKGLGKQVMTSLIAEAKKRGFKTLWAMARAPGFFRRLGFRTESDSELLGIILHYCAQCEDYLTKCRPELLRKEI